MPFPASGSIFWRDIYQTLYEVVWNTVEFDDTILYDFTTLVKIPYVWGQPDTGYIQDKKVFRRGICMTQRQILIPTDDGYEILSEGSSCVICMVQTTYNCGVVPTDPFKYHLDQAFTDEVEVLMACGPRFADPDEEEDTGVLFPPVQADGSVVYIPGNQPFQFVDVWDNEEELIAECDATAGTG